MNSQIQRIKNKDYTKLDQQLHNNIYKTNQIDNNIAQLLEFQAFLRAQVDQIQNQQEKQVVMKASKIVLNNMNNHGFKQKCQCNHKIQKVYEQVTKISCSNKKMKQYYKKQCLEYMEDMRHMIRDGFQHLLSNYNRKSTENMRLKRKISSLQADIDQLKAQNHKLLKSLNEQQQSNKKLQKLYRKDSSASSPINQNQSMSKFMKSLPQIQTDFDAVSRQGSDNFVSQKTNKRLVHDQLDETPRLPMPLRKQSSAIINYNTVLNISEFNQNTQENDYVQEKHKMKRCASVVSRCNSTKSIDSTQNLKINKNYQNTRNAQNPHKDYMRNQRNQNYDPRSMAAQEQKWLEKKGAKVKQQPKRKIKLFSHF